MAIIVKIVCGFDVSGSCEPAKHQHDLGSTKETIIVVVVKCAAVVVQMDLVSFLYYPTPQPVHSPFQDNVV